MQASLLPLAECGRVTHQQTLLGRRWRQDRDGDRRETRDLDHLRADRRRSPGPNPSGGGGGAGGMPLLVWMVMTAPGIV